MQDGFFADPYPFKTLMRTTMGLQHFTIPAPEVGDPLQGLTALTDAISQCLSKRWAYRLPRAVLDRLWLVDPPPWDISMAAVFADGVQPVAAGAVLRGLNVILETPAALRSGPAPVRTQARQPAIGQAPGIQNLTPPSDRTGGGATLRSLSVRPDSKGPDASPPIVLRADRARLMLSGEIDVDLGPLGQFTAPFRERRIETLTLAGMPAPGRAEMALTRPIRLEIAVPAGDLPRGLRRILLNVEIPPEALRLGSPVDAWQE